MQKQDLENRSCKTSHRNTINKTIQLDNIANNKKSPLLNENNTLLDPNNIDFNLSVTEHNKSFSNKICKLNSSIITGNELSENRNTNKKRTPQKLLPSKNFQINPLKKVVVFGDSIVKHVNGSRKLKSCGLKVMSFSEATVRCMADYTKPS